MGFEQKTRKGGSISGHEETRGKRLKRIENISTSEGGRCKNPISSYCNVGGGILKKESRLVFKEEHEVCIRKKRRRCAKGRGDNSYITY